MNDGDWICNDPNCGNINFARRAACYRCNKERPDSKNCKKKLGTEIGKSAAEKSRGLFNADDWQCNKCANVNWARRQTCNVCNAPKFGEVEARTGYGGGYNERGVVEYRRREPSSDDEYDEFGRKKRKRKADSLDKVGITEGPAIKKLPPPMQKDRMDRIAASKMQSSQNDRHVSGSLSDGSVCDVPPLSKVAFRRNEVQSQTNYNKLNYTIPTYNGGQSRKRFTSASDRDQFCSSGYETSSKNSLKSPGVKSYNPVMENRVSSTNNDVVYKFTGPTPAESFQVTYTLEERVNAAAFALVYKNCKISTDRFEAMFDKPAPDFKTIFAWRQRLLSTGCLVDSHLELKKDIEKEPLSKSPSSINTTTIQKPIIRLPNPDEIVINSSSEDEDFAGKDNTKNTQVSKPLAVRQRSASAETLLIGGDSEQRIGGGSISGRDSHVRSQSQSSHQRSRSSSQDSHRSLDSDCVESKPGSQSNSAKLLKQGKQHSSRQSSDSDSDSLSYDSEDNNFLTRVFEKGRQLRRKPKKRPTQTDTSVPETIPLYSTGYTTVKPTQQSPLVTGNIYMTNLRNMNIKSQENIALDTDGYSSEYVPAQLGSSAKNYQAFKDNVRKKGFWAKGNAATVAKNRSFVNNRPPPPMSQVPIQQVQPPLPSSKHFPIQQPPIPQLPMLQRPISHFPIQQAPMQQMPIHQQQPHIQQNYGKQMSTHQSYIPPPLNQQPPIHQPPPPLIQKVVKPVENPIENKNYNCHPQGYTSAAQKPATASNGEDFTKDDNFDLDNFVTVNHYLPFDKNNASQAASVPTLVPIEVENPKENTSRVFDAVQSHSISKNRSILDIFDTSGGDNKSPESNDLEKYDSVRKKYESEWDEDDDALYKVDSPEAEIETPSSPSTPNKSTIKNIISTKSSYELNKEIAPSNLTLNNFTTDAIKDKEEMLMNILKNFQTPKNEIAPQGSTPQKNINTNVSSQISFFDTPLMMTNEPDAMPCNISDEIISMSGLKPESLKQKEKKISPAKKVHVIESITIPPSISESIPGLDPPIHSIPLPQNNPEKNQETFNDYHSTTNQLMTISSQLFVESDNENLIESISEQLQLPQVTNIDQNVHKSSPQTKSPSHNASAVEYDKKTQTVQLQSSVPDLTNLLAGINTDTLLLALQNLTQISQTNSMTQNNIMSQNNSANDLITVHNVSDQSDNIETINLATADEWEKESHRGSIERELEKMDGNTGDTPFLSDIFDPGPVSVPPNVAKRLNLNTSNSEENKNDSHKIHLNQNAPVIGNFKSFALPKPIMLNRLKLTVKPPEKKKPGNAKKNSKRKSKPSSSQGDEEHEEQDDEESGDEADLSKYDLWGSDEEKGNSSKAENAEKSKDGESSKDDGPESNDKNGKSPEAKSSKKRSRSSSSSSSTSSSSSSSHSSTQAPKNKFDDFNLNSERETSPKGRKSRSRSRSPRSRSGGPARRKSRDSRSAGESRTHDSSRDKERSRDRERRDKSRGGRDERKERRYSRDGNGFGAKARHR